MCVCILIFIYLYTKTVCLCYINGLWCSAVLIFLAVLIDSCGHGVYEKESDRKENGRPTYVLCVFVKCCFYLLEYLFSIILALTAWLAEWLTAPSSDPVVSGSGHSTGDFFFSCTTTTKKQRGPPSF